MLVIILTMRSHQIRQDNSKPYRIYFQRNITGKTGVPSKRSSAWHSRRRAHSKRARPRRSALATTETELRLIASAAIIGLSSSPVAGYNAPAATGTPNAL